MDYLLGGGKRRGVLKTEGVEGRIGGDGGCWCCWCTRSIQELREKLPNGAADIPGDRGQNRSMAWMFHAELAATTQQNIAKPNKT